MLKHFNLKKMKQKKNLWLEETRLEKSLPVAYLIIFL